jgi:hypothetical protein
MMTLISSMLDCDGPGFLFYGSCQTSLLVRMSKKSGALLQAVEYLVSTAIRQVLHCFNPRIVSRNPRTSYAREP